MVAVDFLVCSVLHFLDLQEADPLLLFNSENVLLCVQRLLQELVELHALSDQNVQKFLVEVFGEQRVLGNDLFNEEDVRVVDKLSHISFVVDPLDALLRQLHLRILLDLAGEVVFRVLQVLLVESAVVFILHIDVPDLGHALA